MALHCGSARKVDATLAVDLKDDHHDLVANSNLILNRVHTVIGELTDSDESLLARKDLNEAAEAHDTGDLTHVQRADLDLLGDAVDGIKCTLRALRVARRDLYGSVIFHVDIDLEVILQLADDCSALADDVADLLRIDLDGGDSRCEI